MPPSSTAPPASPPPRPGFPLPLELVRRLGSSRFNYWFGYVANLGLVAWLMSRALAAGPVPVSPTRWVLLVVAGLFSWTLAEYWLHRLLYHQVASFLSQGHGLHHREPKALFGVPWYLTTAALLLVHVVLARLFDPASVALVMAGNWTGYVLYCLAHHGSHHWRYRRGWLRAMQHHHLVHHAHPDFNWGFTTSLWDRVFGTHYPPREGVLGPARRRERSRRV